MGPSVDLPHWRTLDHLYFHQGDASKVTASDIIANSKLYVTKNSPEILTGIGVAGVMTTAFFAARGSFRAARDIHEDEKDAGTASDPKKRPIGFLEDEIPRKRFIRRAKLVWPHYIPAGISGFVTIGAVVGSSHAHSKRTSAAISALTITEKAFSEYREKVTEQLGENKEQKLRDEIVEEKLKAHPPKETFIFEPNEVLVCDLMTMRYFKSSAEMLRQAENRVNSLALRHIFVTVADFYEMLGVWPTEDSTRLGWDSERLMELEFTSALTVDNQPCLAFRFNYVKPL